MDPRHEVVRDVLKRHGSLSVDVSTLGDHDSLYQAGLTSHASVSVMLAIEDTFDIEFPEPLLKRSTFESVAALVAAIESIVPDES
jgi:acyl carrier protein